MTVSKLPVWVIIFISTFICKNGVRVQGTSANQKRDTKGNCATFDFEKGNLAGWTRTGTAFNNQPTYGDNPVARNRETAKLQGDWWIGGYENRPSQSHSAGAIQGDGLQGTLTSPPLRLTGNSISFLIGGGNDIAHERVELLVDGKSVNKAAGQNLETMRRVTWDTSSYKGKLARIRLIDKSSESWGHINFDDLTGDFECAPGQVFVQGGCAFWSDTANLNKLPAYKIPKQNWLQTPSIVEISAGHYRALGRVVYMKHLQEHLVNQKRLNFDTTRKTMNLVEQLEILADTIYVEGVVVLRGIKNVKIYAREIVVSKGSRIDVSAPDWNQQYTSAVIPGGNGEDGKHGVNGPRVDIFCDVINGTLDVSSNAGNGHKGLDGGNGAIGRASGHTQRDRWSGDCSAQSNHCRCNYVPGIAGIKGPTGGTGGNAGKPGKGGNAGRLNIRYRKLNGQVQIRSCRGSGAQPAKNGQGGQGGAGGRGGLGRNCKWKIIDWYDKRSCKEGTSGRRKEICALLRSKRAMCPQYPDATVFCRDNGAGSRAPSGPRGSSGSSGTTPNSSAQDGSVSISLTKSGTLDTASKQSFPRELLVIMRRQAEDLLLGNSKDQKGRDALEFILTLTNERSDVKDIKNYAKRKLGFLSKPGYDIFGKNKMFAPRIKWEALEGTVEDVKDAAEKYENAFNDIISTVKDKENFKEMASKMSAVSSLQVEAERRRLVQAKLIAESEKRMCLKAIRYQEEKMTSVLENLAAKLPEVYDKAKFNGQDLLAVLQGTVGFANSIKSKSPLDFIDAALGLAGSLSSKKCLKSFQWYLNSIKKWLTFGKKYTPLNDSSALDFDQVDVTSVPEIMQANLEMNKEKFTAELVCLLDVASLPQDIADFKAEVESFFIAGAARIDLIAKVMDLDNDIGGYMFDIPLLEETEKAIADVNKSPDAPISKALQQNFMDYLLSTYRELERSFMRNLYELHKAFAFRTLWEGNNPLASFQRVASESALGTGRLNGAIQLTEVLQKMKRIKYKAVSCFTNHIYTTSIMKWSFHNAKDKAMFEELGKGNTKFTINIDLSCAKCYNVRLLKIYIELFGAAQPDKVPATVHLQVRHLSGSYFRAGNNTIKQYRQPVGAYKNIKFDRFTITNDTKCQDLKKEGKNTKCSMFCITKDDSRWEPMCSNQLNNLGSCRKDSLLGMEECRSPFGTYELKIPVDKNLACDDPGMKNTNCKDLDVTRFTKMNVWTHLFYWSDQYPTGPDDPICRTPLNKRNYAMFETPQQFLASQMMRINID